MNRGLVPAGIPNVERQAARGEGCGFAALGVRYWRSYQHNRVHMTAVIGLGVDGWSGEN